MSCVYSDSEEHVFYTCIYCGAEARDLTVWTAPTGRVVPSPVARWRRLPSLIPACDPAERKQRAEYAKNLARLRDITASRRDALNHKLASDAGRDARTRVAGRLMNLQALALALMVVLYPRLTQDHPERVAVHEILATAVAEEPSLADADAARERENREQALAIMVAVAWRESAFDTQAVGDHGHSFGLMQINKSSGGSRAFLDDPLAGARHALQMLRTSRAVCPEHPVAWYAEGPRGCSSERAQRISRDRVSLARWALAEARKKKL